MKKIILTGGGTAGHVTPNIALFSRLRQSGYSIAYIGGKNGMEKELVESQNVTYFGISTGKLRRYFDLKNFTDIFRVAKGVSDALKIIRSERPNVIFSKGGFVSVPVVLAAYICKVPVIIHESDITPGLANKISIPFASAVCVSFPETIHKIPKGKGIITGTPIRHTLFNGSLEKGLELCGLSCIKPIILVIGGSSGSKAINDCVRKALPKLLKSYQVIHICGKGFLDDSIHEQGYVQFEYVKNELKHLFAIADIVVSRSGANSIYEFLSLKKPNLLIPLSGKVSRGDQVANAKSFEEQGFSKVLLEEKLTPEELYIQIIDLYNNRQTYAANMSGSSLTDGVVEVMKVINHYTVML